MTSEGGSALLILLDLSTAFNTVDHELLACCLATAGIQGSVLKWLTSFLQDRTQSVIIAEEKSSKHPLNCGVPQGAILFPMLFNIYMRPLAQLVQSFGLGCHQYTDDTQLYLLMDNRQNTPPTALTKCLEAVTN